MTPLRNDRSALPLLLAVLAILVLTIMDALIKRLTDGWSTFDIVATRYTIGALCCVPLVLIQRPPMPSTEMLRANAMRSVVVLATACSSSTRWRRCRWWRRSCSVTSRHSSWRCSAA